MMKIRFCENNDGSGSVFKQLRTAYPELDLKRKKCAKKCSICSSSLFAKVDGDPVTGRNSDELYRKIVELLGSG